MPKRLNSRAAAAKLTWQIIDNGKSLDASLSAYFSDAQLSSQALSDQDKGFVQELVYGVCRWYGELDSLANQLLRSPIRKKDRVVHFVLLVGLYQLHHLDTANHAAVAETVSACKQLNKTWAKNLINGCLRNFLRLKTSSEVDPNRVSHPSWVCREIEKAWLQQAPEIFAANNQRPPMCLRVNRRQCERDEYLRKLMALNIFAIADPYSRDGIILENAVPVSALPNFDLGDCSVQDTAAQLACDLLTPEQGMHILDACAAPGGKTAHILERTDNRAIMHALDISERRCEQLNSTLTRLHLNAEIFVADATDTSGWPHPTLGYDRILIDAPCSGFGVIRRHPDIKHHRRPSDIETLNDTQKELLKALWPTLKPGGLMLYMTCSILPSENESQAKQFVSSQNDAMLVNIDHPNALRLKHGVQTLPGIHDMDGFYYCLIRKADH